MISPGRPGEPAPGSILLLLDLQGIVRSVSPSVIGLLGYNSAAWMGHPIGQFIHPDDLPTCLATLAAEPGGGYGAGPHACRLRRRDGTWHTLVVESATRLLMDPPAVSLLLRDPAAYARQASQLQRLTLAIEQSPAAVMITDLEGRIEYINRRFTEMTGYLPEEVLGQSPRLLKSGLTPEGAYRALWETIGAGKVWRGELCNRRKDGTLYWHSASISPVRDPGGHVTGFVAVQEDITEQRRTHEALAASEREYRRIVDTATEGIWQVDANHRTTFANEQLARMLGYSVPELLGRSVFDFTDEEGRALAERSWIRRQQGIREQLELKFRRRDGSELWVHLSTGPILDEQGRYAGALAMVTDMTARRAAEAAVRRSEAWFRALIEGATELTCVIDTDGAFRYVSPSFESILGYPAEDLLGRTAFEWVHPEDLDQVLAAFAEGLAVPGSVRALQYRFRHRDGSFRVIDGVGRNLLDDPVVGGVVVNGRDMTERTTLEAQFRQAQKMEALGQLVGGVAHDFNNILAVILGASELLQEDLGPETPSRLEVDEIRKAGERAAALTRQLLAFSRRQILVPRVLDLNDLVRSMEGMLTRLLGEDVALRLRLSATPVTVRADPGQLEQVLLNLAVNARDAMPDGGELTVETSVEDLGEGYSATHAPMRPGPHARLSVSDTGAGMDEHTRQHAFDPFFTTKAQGKGTGLGLSTVYGIVKQSEGFVWLYSEPGEGTTFKIYLPEVTERAAPLVPAPVDPALLRGTETVLIAEDNVAVRQFARRALERYGYTVLDGTDTEAEAISAAHRGTIHLLLSDVIMPRIRGPELAAHLLTQRPDLRVLFMSGYTDRAVLQSEIVARGSGYLQKPFTPTLLARRVREVLDG